MPHPDEQAKVIMPTLQEIAERNGFTYPVPRFLAQMPAQKDVPPAPKPRDLPPPPKPAEPRVVPVRLDAMAMMNHTASVDDLLRLVSRMDIIEGRVNIADTVAQIAAMTDAQAQAKAFAMMEALCDFNLAEQMTVVARRKSREGQFTMSKALTTLAREINEQAEAALKEAQK
jgi:hypothetical protein